MFYNIYQLYLVYDLLCQFTIKIMYTCIKRYPIQNFCCGCNLRTGCILIGIIEFLFSIIQITLLIIPPTFNADRNVYIVGQVMYCTLTFVISISLLIGIHKNEQKFLIPWLILKEISCIIGTIIVGILFLLALITGQYIFCIAGVGLIVILGIFYYFWNCLWSYYMELLDQGRYIEPLV